MDKETPYTVEDEGSVGWRVRGPGIVHWQGEYLHDTAILANKQANALNDAYHSGRLNMMGLFREMLGLATFGSNNEVILSREAMGKGN